MDFRIIKTPSPGTIDILMRRKGTPTSQVPENTDAVGLVQGKLIEMVVASDIAEKTVGVTVENMILLAIFGDTASVESAIKAIKADAEEKKREGR